MVKPQVSGGGCGRGKVPREAAGLCACSITAEHPLKPETGFAGEVSIGENCSEG